MRGKRCAAGKGCSPDSAAWWSFVTVGLMKDLGLRFSSQVENKDWGKIKKKPGNGSTSEANS